MSTHRRSLGMSGIAAGPVGAGHWGRSRALTCGCCVAGLLLVAPAPAVSARLADEPGTLDLVAVGIVGHGRAIVLATLGLPHDGRAWRFRSFDTSDLPQPIRDVVLSASGTKLFLQPAAGPGVVLDLTRQDRHGVPLQYVNPRELATDGHARGQSHYLPGQRFVSIRDGFAYVIDDGARVQAEYPVLSAAHGAISEDGIALYVQADGTVVMCGETESTRHNCRELATRLGGAPSSVIARSVPLRDGALSPRFGVLIGAEDCTYFVDPEQPGSEGSPMRRSEAAFRASVILNQLAMSDQSLTSLVDALVRESGDTWAAEGRSITDWRFFPARPDEELYAPVLQFARLETVFPSPFETLEQLVDGGAAQGRPPFVDILSARYLRLDRDARRRRCTFYFRTHSKPGSWLIEYWFYYPFDVGGLAAHPHDPEHMFVEVDKLGGTVRREIGAGHGYMAGNNIYTADKSGARALSLPLFAIVELGKHATAPDVDRDGVFTPGVDENEYREREKIWGVRDVIGTINNHLLPYDKTMSVSRQPQDYLALASVRTRFPDESVLAACASCRLVPLPAGEPREQSSLFRLSDWILLPPCDQLTKNCARRHVTSHPDFLDSRAILKEWAFPESFLRATHDSGPGLSSQSVGLGYAIDLPHVPAVGRVLALPGRLGVDVFHWRQDVNDSDRDWCFADCKRSQGAGWGLRYERFVSNLFGFFGAARVYSPPVHDLWITVGPFVETPLGRRSNLSLTGGVSFRPFASPRFELSVSVGLWKPKRNHLGIRAGKDHRP